MERIESRAQRDSPPTPADKILGEWRCEVRGYGLIPLDPW